MAADRSDQGGREDRGGNVRGTGPGAPKADAVGVRTARTKLAEVVVVCAKCAKRQGLRPRAVRDLLKRAAREASKQASKQAAGVVRGRVRKDRRRKLRVVESGCLGPCPKRAVAVATGASLAAGRVVLLDPAAGPREALAAVLAGAASRSAPDPDFGPNADLAAERPHESPGVDSPLVASPPA